MSSFTLFGRSFNRFDGLAAPVDPPNKRESEQTRENQGSVSADPETEEIEFGNECK